MDRLNVSRLLATTALVFVSIGATAQDQVCVALKTEARLEQEYIDEQGESKKRLVPPEKVVPGDLIVWTITATNTCEAPAERVVIENAVPEHMTYVADSATGPGTVIVYSLDGRAFASPDGLIVREPDGSSRPARPDEIRAIRWQVSEPIGQNASAAAVYRAKVD